jgi:transcriptional regulator with XRE-family HTH domain
MAKKRVTRESKDWPYTWDAEAFSSRVTPLLPHGTQQDVESKAKVPPATISNWKNKGSISHPYVDYMQRLAQALNVSAGWLAFGEGAADQSEMRLLEAIRSFETPPIDTAIRILEALPLPRKVVIRPVERKAKSRRDEFPVYPRVLDGVPGAVALPQWVDLAAGWGEDLEQSDELVYVGDLPKAKGLHCVKVRGDSMDPTFRAGDVLIVRPFPNGGWELPALEPGAPKSSRKQIQAIIPDDRVFILQYIDAGRRQGPTLKRVQYDGEDRAWHMQIVADNPGFKSKIMPRESGIAFLAEVIGIVGQ